MAADAIMNRYLVTLDHSRSLLHGRKSVLKFHVNCITTFRAMVIWKFCKFGLKCLFPPPKFTFLGDFDPKHYTSSSKPPKGTSLGESAAFNVYIVQVRPPVFTARYTLVQSAVLRSHVVCLSVRLSVCPSVCDVGGSGSHRSEILETNCTDT